jgi:hypothetical protein
MEDPLMYLDVKMKMVSKMDIDTRRKLNVYTKLKVPDKLTRDISQTFRNRKAYKQRACVSLDKYCLVRYFNDNSEYLCELLHHKGSTLVVD